LKIWKRAIVLAAGVGFNFLLGWLAISLVFAIGTPSVVIITEIKKNSPAEEVGLLAGDRIADFTKVNDFIDFVKTIPYAFSLYIEFLGIFVNQRLFLPTVLDIFLYSIIHQGQTLSSKCSMTNIGMYFLMNAH